MGGARDPGPIHVRHAAEQHFGLAVEQLKDLPFEVPVAERRARQMSDVDRRHVPDDRGQFLQSPFQNLIKGYKAFAA